MGYSTTASRVGLIDRLNAFRERYGVKSAFFKVVDVVLHKVFRAYVHTVVWLDLEPVAKMACSDPRFSFRFLSADEIEKFAEEPSFFIDPSLADGVRNGREVCFAALEGERLAAFGCYTLGYVPPEPGVRRSAAMSFPADVAYMSYGFTHPDYRGGSIAWIHHGPRGSRSWPSAVSRSWSRSLPVDQSGVAQKLLAAGLHRSGKHADDWWKAPRPSASIPRQRKNLAFALAATHCGSCKSVAAFSRPKLSHLVPGGQLSF